MATDPQVKLTKMTYHMEKKGVQLDKSFEVDVQKLFPEKLYDVASDDYLFRWTDGGTWISVVEEEVFEKEVMRRYPGFLQIPSFVNLRRLFREYKFDWRVNEETSLYEFHHPCFRKDKPELLANIKTRRKSASSTSSRRGRKRQHVSTPHRARTRYSTNRLRSHENHFELAAENNSPVSPNCDYWPRSPENSTKSSDSNVSAPVMPIPTTSQNALVSGDIASTVVRKDFSELKNTYWRNEFGAHPYYSGLPPEVWTQTPMPTCPSAVRVNTDGKCADRVDTSYQTLGQNGQNPQLKLGAGNENLTSQDQQFGKDFDQMPMAFGWGPMPYFFPYHGEVYPPVPQWTNGQGAGDSSGPSPNNKMPQYRHQGMAPYWGYPMPWGFPDAIHQDPNGHQFKPDGFQYSGWRPNDGQSTRSTEVNTSG